MAAGLPHDTGGWTEMHLFYIHYSIKGKTRNSLSDCTGLFEHLTFEQKQHSLRLTVNVSTEVTTTALIRHLHNKQSVLLLIELCVTTHCSLLRLVFLVHLTLIKR